MCPKKRSFVFLCPYSVRLWSVCDQGMPLEFRGIRGSGGICIASLMTPAVNCGTDKNLGLHWSQNAPIKNHAHY